MNLLQVMLAAFSGAKRNTREELTTLRMLVPVGSIANKPVPRWPDPRSYRAHQRDAAKRRNIAKGGRR